MILEKYYIDILLIKISLVKNILPSTLPELEPFLCSAQQRAQQLVLYFFAISVTEQMKA